jgi:hypothetical protein
VVITIGELAAFTGTLVVSHLAIGMEKGLSYKIFVGVPKDGCSYEKKKSYPFIILAKKIPLKGEFVDMRGIHRQNFGDGCKQPVSAKSNNWRGK